jgi:hypothetical protein
MTPREVELHSARVMLAEARKRRANGEHRMAATMLQWAANARRRAGAKPPAAAPIQPDLFGWRDG